MPVLDVAPPALTHRSSSGKLYHLMKPTLSEAFEQAGRLDERRKSIGESPPASVPPKQRYLLIASLTLNIMLLAMLLAVLYPTLTP